MSLLAMFSVCPSIEADEGHLRASTSWWVRLLSLGSFNRRLVVNREEQTVTFERKVAWFFRRMVSFTFRQIAAVTYGYEDLHPLAWATPSHDGIDRFVVGLKIWGQEEIALFSFVGEGSFTNNGPLPDWWYWKEYLMDFTGSQEGESRLFVVLLSKLIGVRIEPSTLIDCEV